MGMQPDQYVRYLKCLNCLPGCLGEPSEPLKVARRRAGTCAIINCKLWPIFVLEIAHSEIAIARNYFQGIISLHSFGQKRAGG